MNGQMERSEDKSTDIWADRTGGWMDGQMDGWTAKQAVGWTDRPARLKTDRD